MSHFEKLQTMDGLKVQAYTPQVALKPLKQSPANSLVALFWCTVLILCPLFMGGMTQVRGFQVQSETALHLSKNFLLFR